jgi:hypothetical protein
MKNVLIFALTLVMFFAFAKSEESLLPCVSCVEENKPVCAKPTSGGPPQTFQSRCLVTAMDCGHKEHRKFITKLFKKLRSIKYV